MQRGLRMKRVLVASVVLLLSHSIDARAAGGGPFDGQWTGSATSAARRCGTAKVTATVEGAVVIGQARFPDDASEIRGTVRDDGTFGATIGWQPLKGKFSGDDFDGAFKNGDCEWKMLLKRAH